MKPDHALDTWPDWDITLRSKPMVLGPLIGGRSNRSFLLDSDGTRMVLRLSGAESVLPGANRSSEYVIWQAAGAQGIAPPLLYIDDRSRFLVSTFIENNLPPQPALNSVLVNHAFDLLERSHQLDLDVPCIDYASHIEKYWQIIDTKGHPTDHSLYKIREPMQRLLVDITNNGHPTGLCHHDLVKENFVGNQERLYLIDWEYAANGLLVMDYAALGVEWGLNNEQVCTHAGIEAELMTMATNLYRYLCRLWEAATA